MHVGTFTREGTWAAAARELPELARLGITVIEVMPVADFHGRFGWGYDGVNLFAPTRLYGTPGRLPALRRHGARRRHRRHPRRRLQPPRAGRELPARVLAGVLHRPLRRTSGATRSTSTARTRRRSASSSSPTPATGSTSFISTACGSTRRSRSSTRPPRHILAAIGRARARGGRRPARSCSSPRTSRRTRGSCGRSTEGGYGLDALWNDDFHHSAMVALTGRAEAYYTRHARRAAGVHLGRQVRLSVPGPALPLAAAAARHAGVGPAAAAFVIFLQNHDQVANSARGLRGHQLTSPARWRAMTALLLLLPGTPMLFQGQEFSASAPFLYFADLEPELAAAVRKGRGGVSDAVSERRRASCDRACSPIPAIRRRSSAASSTSASAQTHAGGVRAASRSAATAARGCGVPRAAARAASTAPCSSPRAFALRFFTDDHCDDRAADRQSRAPISTRPSFAEPLLAPPAGGSTGRCRWSSEDPAYGGRGTPEIWAGRATGADSGRRARSCSSPDRDARRCASVPHVHVRWPRSHDADRMIA